MLRAAPDELADALPPGSVEANAWHDLRACRTAAAGGQLVRCTTCAHEHPGDNSWLRSSSLRTFSADAAMKRDSIDDTPPRPSPPLPWSPP